MRKAIASGQNQQQIVAAKLTKDFNEKTQEAVLGQPSGIRNEAEAFRAES
ncbi:MAG TPA: hypothetical protein VKB50_15010 [Vicinamibacterales bacterium]|nr:hypothetical protein [Vicinamibacterales bacterium]